MSRPFQRIGSVSNAHVGRAFELAAQRYFSQQGLDLNLGHTVDVGIGANKKPHKFDLGCSKQKIIVECKSHRWTISHNVPSAKLTTWNEAMYYFHAAPSNYRKIMFVLKDIRHENGESLAHHYLRTYGHLIPADVELWEYDVSADNAAPVCA